MSTIVIQISDQELMNISAGTLLEISRPCVDHPGAVEILRDEKSVYALFHAGKTWFVRGLTGSQIHAGVFTLYFREEHILAPKGWAVDLSKEEIRAFWELMGPRRDFLEYLKGKIKYLNTDIQ